MSYIYLQRFSVKMNYIQRQIELLVCQSCRDGKRTENINRQETENIRKWLPKYFRDKFWFEVPFNTWCLWNVHFAQKVQSIWKHGTDDDSLECSLKLWNKAEHCSMKWTWCFSDENEELIQDAFGIELHSMSLFVYSLGLLPQYSLVEFQMCYF